MGHVSEPKNVDLMVGPSILTEDAKNKIAEAIAQYKKTGKKPASAEIITHNSVTSRGRTQRSKSIGAGH
jgi:hypothetical protein